MSTLKIRPHPERPERGVSPRALSLCSSPEARALLPLANALAHCALPLSVSETKGARVLHVALPSKCTPETNASLRFATGVEIRSTIVGRESLHEAIYLAYAGDGNKLAEISSPLLVAEPIASTPELAIKEHSPAGLLNALLEYAVAHRASDIHLLPRREGCFVRLRQNGALLTRDQPLMGSHAYRILLGRLRVLTRAPASSSRGAFDGAFVQTILGAARHVRVSVLPTLHGEKAVLRLEACDDKRHIDDLDLPAPGHRAIEEFLERPGECLMVCGATGSGKTTTLYALARTLAARSASVVTLEDPIERSYDELCQTEVSSGGDLSYHDALRSVLRQDPDVILIGEIRDGKALTLVLQAALTGHKVLTSLHANTPNEAMRRLQSLGLTDEALLCSVTTLLMQQLRPISCKCATGCSSCDGSRTVGRALEASVFTRSMGTQWKEADS